MEKFRKLLLEVWREACRHIHITESTTAIAAMLQDRMPLEQILVRRIDPRRCCVETVAAGLSDSSYSLEGGRTELNADQIERLLVWCRRGRVCHRKYPHERPGEDAEPWSLLGPKGIARDVLAGPLTDQRGPSGVLLVIAREGQEFGVEDDGLLCALVEPFSVALENDEHVHEMAVLREAAEADKRSLLTRLGRQELGETIVGAAVGLRAVMERVELVARSDVPVLIFGETGTGKELVSRAIHVRSKRAAGPFMRVNCGAFPPELIDSQLFGHERGSFTGATDTHRGWFERADRGTLFLDEIGELPHAAQVRLLRVLQDGMFERVGGQQSIGVDVRIVAATHRDLSGMVREGRFREDLWYRLAVFPIDLPPLRERVEDIPALARHFAQRAATRFGLPVRLPTPEDTVLLIAYPWPGNVRELGTVMDRAAILGDGRQLEVAKALGVQTPGIPPRSEPARPTAAAPPPPVLPLDEAMKNHIETALAATRGRIEGPFGAAALLKINPHTLRARMRKLGIDWSRFREPV